MSDDKSKNKIPIDWVESFSFDAKFAFETAAAKQLAKNALGLPNTTTFQLLSNLPYMVVGGLNAKDLPTDNRHINMAFEELFDPMAIEQMLMPHELGKLADKNPPQFPRGNEPLFSQGGVPEKMYQRALLSSNLSAAVACGIRANVADLANEPLNSLVIHAVQSQIADALGEVIENTHQGALSNPDHDFWQGETLFHMIFDMRDAIAKKAKFMGLVMFDEPPEEPKPPKP